MKRTRKLTTPPVFISCATVVGREESEGPLGNFYKVCLLVLQVLNVKGNIKYKH